MTIGIIAIRVGDVGGGVKMTSKNLIEESIKNRLRLRKNVAKLWGIIAEMQEMNKPKERKQATK